MSKPVDLPDPSAEAESIQKACGRSDLIGNIFTVQGRRYVLNLRGLVYDVESEKLIKDIPIVDEVYRHFEEKKTATESIRAEAKRLSEGDPILEEMRRVRLTILGNLQPQMEAV